MSELFPDVASLLAAHGIPAEEEPMTTSGFSGARHSSLARASEGYVLKRLRYDDDWLMRLTHDSEYREAAFAVSPIAVRFPVGVATPSLGASYDGDGRAILMRDISDRLLPDAGVVATSTMHTILGRIADLHAAFWDDPMDDARVPWCSLSDRLGLLSLETGEMLVQEGRDFGLARGWQAFERLAPPQVSAWVRRLSEDRTPLLQVLDALPCTLLHGDLKSANFGSARDELALLDWAMVMVGPVAIDLGWMLAVNSSVLPWTLDETLDRYAGHLKRALGADRFASAMWQEQRAATMLCGVLLYGWGKALDAEAGQPDELRWWCEGAVAAARRFGL